MGNAESGRRREVPQDGSMARTIWRSVQNHKQYHDQKLPVIWLETCDSGDNNIAFMSTTYPFLERVFKELIDLLYCNSFMAAQGSEAGRRSPPFDYFVRKWASRSLTSWSVRL